MVKKKQSFFKRINKKYKLSVADKVTFLEIYSTSISILKFWAVVFLIFIAGVALVVILFFYTPIRNLVPGYPTPQTRMHILQNAIMVDSLYSEIEMRDNYLAKIQTIISGGVVDDNVDEEFDFPEISMATMGSDTIFERLVGPEKYRFSYFMSDEGILETPRINFFVPVRGIVTNRFHASPGHFGVDVVADENSPIMAVLEGTVIFAEWSITTGNVIQLQHDYNLVSIYKHNSEILVKPGDRVKAGDVIAIMGDEGEYSTGPHLHLELWQNGIPLDPEMFINFKN